MITANDIVEATAEAAQHILPELVIYKNLVPQKFQRPSILVEETGLKCQADAIGTGMLECTVRVTCLVSVDPYHNSHMADLSTLELALLGIFAKLYLTVKNRALHVASLAGRKELDFATVSAVLQWDEDVSEFRPEQLLPLISTVNLKTEVENHEYGNAQN